MTTSCGLWVNEKLRTIRPAIKINVKSELGFQEMHFSMAVQLSIEVCKPVFWFYWYQHCSRLIPTFVALKSIYNRIDFGRCFIDLVIYYQLTSKTSTFRGFLLWSGKKLNRCCQTDISRRCYFYDFHLIRYMCYTYILVHNLNFKQLYLCLVVQDFHPTRKCNTLYHHHWLFLSIQEIFMNLSHRYTFLCFTRKINWQRFIVYPRN